MRKLFLHLKETISHMQSGNNYWTGATEAVRPVRPWPHHFSVEFFYLKGFHHQNFIFWKFFYFCNTIIELKVRFDTLASLPYQIVMIFIIVS